MKLSYLIVQIGTVVILITFIISIIFLKKNKPQYYNYILAYIILGLLISTNTIFNNNNSWLLNKKIPILTEQVLSLFQSLLLGLFFIQILRKSIFIKTIKYLLFLSLFIQGGLIILVLHYNTEIRPSLSSTLSLLIFCLFYIRDLMTTKPTLNLTRSSTFWLTMGIFYSSSISFPVNSLFTFIPKTDVYQDLRSQIFSITNITIIIFYLFIIKSYLCLKHQQNLS